MALILFVDDEELTLKLLKQAATILGHNAITSTNTEEAFALASSELPDLILTDVNLEGERSFDMIERLKNQKKTSHIPILTLSALALEEIEPIAQKIGADASLSKPIRLQILLEVIREYTQHD
jgi:two-component system cell cycle response regulator DivK